MEDEKVVVKAEFSLINIWGVVCFIIAGLFIIAKFVLTAIDRGGAIFYSLFFLPAAAAIVIGIALRNKRSKLTATKSRVTGVTFTGKRVDLPISQVSAIGAGSLNRVTVSTSSGVITFYGVLNQDEVYKGLTDILLQREDNITKKDAYEKESTTVIQQEVSNADELKKYKDLFDSGVITEEEFNAKKKQILGL